MKIYHSNLEVRHDNGERTPFVIVKGSDSLHCCFEYSILFTGVEEHEEYPCLAETMAKEYAVLIASNLNKYVSK